MKKTTIKKTKLYYKKQDIMFRYIVLGIITLVYVPIGYLLYLEYTQNIYKMELFKVHYLISVICLMLFIIGFYAEKYINKKYLGNGLYTSGAFIAIALIFKEIFQQVFSENIIMHIALISGLTFMNFYFFGCFKLTYELIQYLKEKKQDREQIKNNKE